jgi:hypothetical protein
MVPGQCDEYLLGTSCTPYLFPKTANFPRPGFFVGTIRRVLLPYKVLTVRE